MCESFGKRGGWRVCQNLEYHSVSYMAPSLMATICGMGANLLPIIQVSDKLDKNNSNLSLPASCLSKTIFANFPHHVDPPIISIPFLDLPLPNFF